jgi:hypothetical protein
MYFIFQFGGYQVMGAAILTLLGTAFVIQFFKSSGFNLRIFLIALGTLVMMYVSYDGVVDSKWVQNTRTFAFSISVLSCLFLSSMIYYISARASHIKQAGAFTALLLSAVFWVVVIPSASGYKMTERFSTSTEDLSHRTSHWANTLSYMDNSLSSTLFGKGLGSFPMYYFLNHLSDNTTVNYAFLKNSETNFLSMSGGDYNITQKVNISEETNYSIFLRARSERAARLTVKFCPRHIIFSSRYTPECVSQVFELKPGGEWSIFEANFYSDNLGKSRLLYWPIAVQLQHGTLGAKLDIADFNVLDEMGVNIIANSDFSHGADRWSFVRDFSHDDWHTKNIYLNYYFEQGLLGILSFLIIIAFASITQIKALKNSSVLSPVFLASIAGVLTVGLFGSIVDNPRVAFLFLLIVSFCFINVPQQTDKT